MQRAELHGFSDASNMAYSDVIYLKVVSQSGEVTITLLAGKSKVAPLSPLSIPRLELSGAVLLARLLEFVRGAFDAATFPCICWTDSTVVLAWLQQHPTRWKTFVANRVADVQSRLPGVGWRYTPGADNPADCASRGVLGDELVKHSLWWQGPSWLRSDSAAWPSTPAEVIAKVSLDENRVSVNIAQHRKANDLSTRFSSWHKLLCVTAYIFRFISRCRKGPADTERTEPSGIALTSPEYRHAKTFWIRTIQADLFSSEISTLANHRTLAANNPILSLRPFLDQNGLLRVGGRLRHAPLPFATRHPLLLSSHPLVLLIVDQVHKRLLHAGLQLTLSTLRSEFWIIRARSLVKTILHRCVVCTRERAAIPSQLMGDLPAVRVTASTRAFVHCGLDYAGPVYVRASAGRGITSRKAYISLFVCLATKAIHVELVADYSTPAFLNAYSRFCSRRGLPQAI